MSNQTFLQQLNPHFDSHPGSSQHWRRPCRAQEGESPGREAALRPLLRASARLHSEAVAQLGGELAPIPTITPTTTGKGSSFQHLTACPTEHLSTPTCCWNLRLRSTDSFQKRLSEPKGTFPSSLLKQVRCTQLLCSLRSACDRPKPLWNTISSTINLDLCCLLCYGA